MRRTAVVSRATKETEVSLRLNVDGTGESEISTGCGFLNHMLTLLARHGNFDMSVSCSGDVNVDYHHTTEDIGICLGQALREAMGDKRGITRYGSIALPMDEALVLCAADFSGRGGFYADLQIPTEKVGDFDTELCEEFFGALCREAGLTMHLRQLSGKNSHHIIEACFKAAGRSLRQAVAQDAANPTAVPSTKGTLS
ncbi:MAG: imidazoleglycerol-phosphate dehydratase HisB [Oscillospiraceae bacterium]|nr:imidazoleglycerol-phosphate dehydratase HisB [Oscillospiraceae bacterium]